jgi:hypothetical protein
VRDKGIVTRPYDPECTKEITFFWNRNVLLAELIYSPDEDSCRFFQYTPEGKTALVTSVSGYGPPRWIKSYARKAAIRLPTGVRDYGSLDELIQNIRNHIHSYFECDQLFESVATLFIPHTWIYERFQAVPYLRFCGLPQTGKTRGIEVIASICYHAHSISGSVTAAPMFRTIEVSGGTTIIDEADFKDSDVGTDVMKILNCGYQQGQPVSRMEKDKGGKFVPRLYDVFGPKVIGGRQRFRDDATESRCLSYTPLPNRREGIPLQLPDDFHHAVSLLQNQLLKWRLDTLESVSPNAEYVSGTSRRVNQIIQPLLTVADMMNASERERYRSDLLAFAKRADNREKEVGSESVEAAIVRALFDCAQKGEQPTCKQLAKTVLEAEGQNITRLEQWLSPNKIGRMVREMGFETKHTRTGAVIVPDAMLTGFAAWHAGLASSQNRRSKSPTVTEIPTVVWRCDDCDDDEDEGCLVEARDQRVHDCPQPFIRYDRHKRHIVTSQPRS